MIIQITLPFAIKTERILEIYAQNNDETRQTLIDRKEKFAVSVAEIETELDKCLANGYTVISANVVELESYSAIHYVLFRRV